MTEFYLLIYCVCFVIGFLVLIFGFYLVELKVMYEEIKERIDVVAVFKGGQALPHSFRWKGRKYLVEKINLEHQEKRGDSLLFCFSVIANGNTYELSFDSEHLTWTLEKIWEE